MLKTFQEYVSRQLAEIRAAGTYKSERVIMTPQGATIRVGLFSSFPVLNDSAGKGKKETYGKPVLNLCANNYLGLAQHPAVAASSKTMPAISLLKKRDLPLNRAW